MLTRSDRWTRLLAAIVAQAMLLAWSPALAQPVPVPTPPPPGGKPPIPFPGNPNPPGPPNPNPPAPIPFPPPAPAPAPNPPPNPGSGAITVILIILAILAAIAFLIWAIPRLARKLLRDLFCYPTLVSFTAVRTPIVVEKQQADCWMNFGAFPPSGITFTAVVQLPGAKCSGELEFLQDLNGKFDRNNGRGAQFPHECIETNGVWMLDDSDPYDGPFPVRGIGPHTVTTNDTPGILLDAELSRMDFKFRMFLLWRPNGWPRWVRFTVGRLDWWCKGAASTTGVPTSQCFDGVNNFMLTSPPTNHGSGPGRPTLEPPVTAPNFLTVKAKGWQKC